MRRKTARFFLNWAVLYVNDYMPVCCSDGAANRRLDCSEIFFLREVCVC